MPSGETYVVVLRVRGKQDPDFVTAYPRRPEQVRALQTELRPTIPGAQPSQAKLQKSKTPPYEGGALPGAGDLQGHPVPDPLVGDPRCVTPSEKGSPPATADKNIEQVSALFKAQALGAGERWITVHPNGPGEKGTPILIKVQPDGSAKVLGGAGGKLNHLRLHGVKSEADYRAEAQGKDKAYRDKRREQAASGAAERLDALI